MLHDTYTTLRIVHQSPTELDIPNLKQPCALWCIPYPCSFKTEYYWYTIPENGDLFADSPVIFVDKPLVYCCKVIVGKDEVSSESIRIKVTPGKLLSDIIVFKFIDIYIYTSTSSVREATQ